MTKKNGVEHVVLSFFSGLSPKYIVVNYVLAVLTFPLLLLNWQVEKAFREGTARQNAHSIFVCLALSLLEERVRVACKEITTLEKQVCYLDQCLWTSFYIESSVVLVTVFWGCSIVGELHKHWAFNWSLSEIKNTCHINCSVLSIFNSVTLCLLSSVVRCKGNIMSQHL